jgi:hypothetical protein
MKKLLLLFCTLFILLPGCHWGLGGDSYTYVDAYGCEVTVTEDYYTGLVCEETWCFDSQAYEWYLYDEYCY